MEAFTLFELNEHIRRVIALNFEAPIWVKCEISQIKESRGNFYLELVQKDEQADQVIAHSSAAIWSRNYWFIKKKHGELVDDLLQDGVELKIRVKVDFHERYGLKLVIEDLDTAFTIGQIEIKRRQIIEQLKKEGLLEVNARLPLPRVLQKIAVISSSGAAGLQDFEKQLMHNHFGYAFDIRHYDSAVQGARVEKDVVSRLREIQQSNDVDCIAIIRGGGSRIDLASFDSYEIAEEIARCRFPVLIGIGHDIDQSVLDLACHTSLKTPTAVADFLVQHNAHFEEMAEQLMAQIRLEAGQLAERHNRFILRAGELLRHLPVKQIGTARQQLFFFREQLIRGSLANLVKAQDRLREVNEKIDLLDPAQVLRKGYSITQVNGKAIRSVKGVRPGSGITTILADGQIISEVKKTENDK